MTQINQAKRASDFISSIGVNTHISYYNTAYSNETAVVADLEYLGIDHVRDAAPIISDQDYWVPFEQDMAAGIKFDLVIAPNALSIATDIADLNALQASHPGGIDAIEGINEGGAATAFAGLTGDAAINAFQTQLFIAVHSDPNLAGVQVYDYTLNTYSAAARTQFGNISAGANFGNAHIYAGYYAPSYIIPSLLPLQLLGTPDDPFVVTETGYDTMPGQDSDGSQGVNDDVQAKYTLDDVFDLIKAGAGMVYIYELLDEMPDPNMTDHEQHFGLFNNDGTPKEAAVALHNLTSILADPGASASTFTPGTLAYTITGLPSTGNSLLLEKSNGSFDLAIWAEPAIWNPTTLTEIPAAAIPVTVTVTLGQAAGTIEVFDPLSGTTPIATYSGVSQITIGITDHPLIIEFDPISAPVVSGVPSTQTASGAFAPFVALKISDLATQNSATVVLSATTHGSFGNLGIGAYSVQTGTYSVSGTSAQVASALRNLTFTPTGDSTTSFRLSVTNQSGSGSTVTSIIDAAPLTKPTMSGVPITQAAGQSVLPLANLQLTDAAAEDGASVILYTTTQGTLSNFGTGSYSASTGIYSVSGTPAQVAAALQHLTFTPSAGAAMAYTTTFWYGISNQAGTSTYVTSVTGSAPLPAPTLSGVAASQVGSGVIAPFATLQLTNLTTTVGAMVMLSAPAQGTFGNLGTGSYSSTTGSYTVSGTPAQVLSALRQLTFTPAGGSPILTTTSFTLSVSSTVGSSHDAISVTEVNQSLLPVPSGERFLVAAWTGGANAVPTPIAGAYNEAVVATPASGSQIVAPAGFQAVLLGGTNAVTVTDVSQGGVVLAANHGADTLQAKKAGDTLIGGSGTDTYIVTGGDTVVAGNGITSISSSGGNKLKLGTGVASISSTGGDTILASSGAATISAGTGAVVVAGSGSLTFIGGAGTTKITDASGSILVTAPSQVVFSASSATINASGGMFQQIVLSGGGNRTVVCGSGTETVNASGSTGANVLMAGSGNDQIIGGSGNTVIVAGRGNDTLSAAGPTQFEFMNGAAGGNDIIADFSATADRIVLEGYAAGAITAVVQSAQIVGGSTMLQLADGGHLSLTGITGVNSSWFSTSTH